MTRIPPAPDGERPSILPKALWVAGLAAGIAAFALPSASYDPNASVRNGLAGVAAAIVSAGAFVAAAITGRR